MKKQFDLVKFLAEWQYIINFIFCAGLLGIFYLIIGIPKIDQIYLILIYALPIILFILNFIRFNLWLYAKIRVKTDLKNNVEFYQCRRVSVTDGEPGTGKTSSNLYNSYAIAEYNYKKLKIEYSLLAPFARQIESGKDIKKKRHWFEVKEAFEFWAKNFNRIPCLLSSVPLVDFYGRISEKLTQAHIEQKKKTLYLSVWFNDEIGMSNPADGKRGKNKNLLVSESGRFIRHFFDGYWLNTDQDSGNVAIDLKRVVALNRTMLEQKPFLKPLLVTNIYNFLCDKLIKKFKNINQSNFLNKISEARAVNKKYIKFLVFLNRYIKASGFRIYKFIDKGNKIKSNPLFKNETKIKTQYAPSLLNCKYDDRCFANSYKAKKLKFEDDSFENLVLSEEELQNLFQSI